MDQFAVIQHLADRLPSIDSPWPVMLCCPVCSRWSWAPSYAGCQPCSCDAAMRHEDAVAREASSYLAACRWADQFARERSEAARERTA